MPTRLFVHLLPQDLIAFDEELANRLRAHPVEFLSVFEAAAKEAAREAAVKLGRDDDELVSLQIVLTSSLNPIPIRSLQVNQPPRRRSERIR